MKPLYEIGAPIYVPEREGDMARLLSANFAAVQPLLLAAVEEFLGRRDPTGLLRLEERLLRLLSLAEAHIAAGVVAFLHGDVAWVEAAIQRARARAKQPTRQRGLRTSPVRFLGGASLSLRTPYVNEDGGARPGPKRGDGRRGPTGSGCYPVLEALGIRDQATPALQSEVARQATRNASFAEAREALHDRGIDLDFKTVRTLALKVGAGALVQREERIAAAMRGEVFSAELAGKRIVLSTDGGRVRFREGGKRGRRGKNGRRRFQTPWREPKLVTAYVIDEAGRKVKAFPAVYEGTFGDADEAFVILTAELLLRGAARAKEVILTADGARWIWNRADELARVLGLEPQQIVKVADFYHAVEHLTAIAELCARWSETERKQWVRRMRRLLKAGKVERVLDAVRRLCRGRNAGKIRTEFDYFHDRRDLMRYDEFRRRGIPMGSGAVESAVRRVVNLRMKGPSMFWRGPNAECILHMRCYLKAGRWEEMMNRVMFGIANDTAAKEGQRHAA